MSALSCNRGDCKNIMCDRLSDTHGYICNDCFDELVELGPQTYVEFFMNSDKIQRDASASHAYFDELFSFQ